METKTDLRVGDREREATADALREHAAEGRLDPEELEERLGQAYAARTNADLARLTYDLPARDALPAPPARSMPEGVTRAILTAVAIDLLAVAGWVASGDAFDGGWDEFWPKWVFILTTVWLVRRLTRARRS
jgi:hypothetical protein